MGKGNTPEGKVKKGVDKILTHFGVLYKKPVITGFGKRELDYYACVLTRWGGQYMVIETKAEGNWLTGRQRELCKEAYLAGGKVFIISNGDGMTALWRYLQRVSDELSSDLSGADPV